ncbi:MAG: hypothetical protein VW338_00025 [Rhodospirillaceae bacterium]
MAVLYIAEYDRLATDSNGRAILAGTEPPIAEQTVAIGGTSTASSAFNSQTRYVRIHTDAICHTLFGKTPTATTGKQRMAADQTEFKAVTPGDKVAVIEGT